MHSKSMSICLIELRNYSKMIVSIVSIVSFVWTGD